MESLLLHVVKVIGVIGCQGIVVCKQSLLFLHIILFPSIRLLGNNENQRKKALYAFGGYHPGFGRIVKGSKAELIAAGWPSWMVEDAGEALKGWVPRKEKSFQKLEKIGEGICSHVYRVLDLEQNNLVTLKRHFTQATPSKYNKIGRSSCIIDVIQLLPCFGVHLEYDLAGLASHLG